MQSDDNRLVKEKLEAINRLETNSAFAWLFLNGFWLVIVGILGYFLNFFCHWFTKPKYTKFKPVWKPEIEKFNSIEGEFHPLRVSWWNLLQLIPVAICIFLFFL